MKTVVPKLPDRGGADRAGYRLLQHTADMGILAWGPRQEDVLLQSARGLLEILGATGSSDQAERRQERLRLAFATPEELLVDWLNELVFLVAVQGFRPTAITIDRLSEQRLAATVLGERAGPAAPALATEVKAATYHQVAFRKRKGHWEGRIYLDL